MFCCLLVISTLTWGSAVSSPAAVQHVEFHPWMENFAPNPDPDNVRFPHEISCHHFYHKLSEEDISIKKCPEDEMFDYLKHRCVEKESARCWNRLIKHVNHESVHVHYQKKEDRSKCPHPFGQFPDLTDCTRYYQCLGGNPKSKKCAPYEYFDKIKRKCMAEIKAICADHTDVIEPDYVCPRSWGSFSFSKDCSKYYECYERQPDLRTCKNHMLFDERKMKCMPQKKTNCGSRHNPYNHHHHTTPSIPTTEEIQEASHPTDLPKTSYEPLVTNGHSSSKLPTKFDSSENKDVSSEGDSKENSGEVVVEKTDPTVVEPVAPEFITPEKEKVISETIQTTVETKEIPTENIPTTEQSKECHSEDKTCILEENGDVLRCSSPNGLFPHPKDLHKFLHCSNNAIYVKKCPLTLIFIESKRACSWQISQFKN